MLAEIKATFICDKCGEEFTISLDPPYKPPKNWCLYDVASDKLKGTGDHYLTKSVQFCKDCTIELYRKRGY